MFRPVRHRASVTVLSALVLVAGCGGAAPSATTAPTPRVTPTPDPHLAEPASVDQVIASLAAMGMTVITNNASRGRDGEPVKIVNATFAGWPLSIAEYSSTAKRRELHPLDGSTVEGTRMLLAGLNILVLYGPPDRPDAPSPDPGFMDSALALAQALEPLLGPLEHAGLLAPAASPASPDPSPSAAP
ncbi:MAG TPA: hypothetical protein VFK54_00855 [Candidatus Limnocylindrales bacterium]|nr:hypothetical protein [Candidatus Limnocylindrales bacterium]